MKREPSKPLGNEGAPHKKTGGASQEVTTEATITENEILELLNAANLKDPPKPRPIEDEPDTEK